MHAQSSPPNQLFRLAMSHLVPRALQVVAELGVADHLDEEAVDAATLAAATGTGALPERLGRLLRLLAANGVFETTQDGRFRHNDLSRLLRSDHPQSMRDHVAMLGMPGRWRAVGELKHAVLTEESGMQGAFVMGAFEYNTHHPEEGALFDRAMRARARLDVAAVVAGYDFSDRERIADIGGGSGHLLEAILEKSSGQGVLFELPKVAERVAAGLPRFEVAAGDFFSDPLPPADTYLLMQVLHDWADEEARQILTVARRAAWPGARLLVIEMLIPEDNTPQPARELDVLMMAVTGGRERTEHEYATLMAAADWRFERAIPLMGSRVILEGTAA